MTPGVKVGLMVPVNNTTMERELMAWMPAGSACSTLRVPRGKGLLTEDSIPEYKAQALALARAFAPHEPDVVAYGCTAASFISGMEGDTRFAGALADITGKPVVTTAQAMVAVLREEQAKDIALVTPYADAINARLKGYLADSGIRVRRFSSFDAADVEALGRIQAGEVAALAAETMSEDCDALFIACSQLPTF
jgi:maleate cis-trans isomerase